MIKITNPSNPIKQVEKEKLREKLDEKKPSTDTSADPKSKEREEERIERIKNAREEEYLKIKSRLADAEIEEKQSFREEREKYANRTFLSVWIYVGIVIGIVVVDGVIAVCYDKDFLESIPLATLIGTVSASMVLFGWILKGLFSYR